MNEKIEKMNPVVGLSFERISEQDISQIQNIFNTMGGFKTVEMIKKYGHIGINGRMVKIDYITFNDEGVVFEPIKP